MSWDALGARVLPTLAFHTQQDGWEFWLSHDQRLIHLIAEPADDDYFAAAAAKPTDLCIRLFDVVGRHMLYPDLAGAFAGLRRCLHNLGASLEKIDYFVAQHHTKAIPTISQFAETELEYLLVISRSMFDLFQTLFAAFWRRVRLHAQPNTPTKPLPDTFSKLILEKKSELRTAKMLVAKYLLPEHIASAFAAAGAFFQQIRRTRDLIIHHGHKLPLIFETDHGLALPADTPHFSGYGVWRPAAFLPNNLASLRPVLAYIVWQTIASFDTIIRSVEDAVTLPPDPVPGFRLFTRGWHTAALHRYARVSPESPWWH